MRRTKEHQKEIMIQFPSKDLPGKMKRKLITAAWENQTEPLWEKIEHRLNSKPMSHLNQPIGRTCLKQPLIVTQFPNSQKTVLMPSLNTKENSKKLTCPGKSYTMSDLPLKRCPSNQSHMEPLSGPGHFQNILVDHNHQTAEAQKIQIPSVRGHRGKVKHKAPVKKDFKVLPEHNVPKGTTLNALVRSLNFASKSKIISACFSESLPKANGLKPSNYDWIKEREMRKSLSGPQIPTFSLCNNVTDARNAHPSYPTQWPTPTTDKPPHDIDEIISALGLETPKFGPWEHAEKENFSDFQQWAKCSSTCLKYRCMYCMPMDTFAS
ncbi:uncharacterized protein LOC103096759 [Monodelphis domestica]|uniref:uncharacterized protein LOC103096759 n=1 Tax=Monodelphis domestica TaxID=13616 RepID=UPI0004433981|nr:uncharacterized protein LOC103096759 [Monodelphis domestica]XP_056662781.1 uncharacterized protein LOC103096759 [Monodelphis domestica]